MTKYRLISFIGCRLSGLYADSMANEILVRPYKADQFLLNFDDARSIIFNSSGTPHWKFDGELDIVFGSKFSNNDANQTDSFLPLETLSGIVKRINLIFVADNAISNFLKIGRLVQVELILGNGRKISTGYFGYKDEWEYSYSGDIFLNLDRSLLNAKNLDIEGKYVFSKAIPTR
jgi:hypothetical protein